MSFQLSSKQSIGDVWNLDCAVGPVEFHKRGPAAANVLSLYPLYGPKAAWYKSTKIKLIRITTLWPHKIINVDNFNYFFLTATIFSPVYFT